MSFLLSVSVDYSADTCLEPSISIRMSTMDKSVDEHSMQNACRFIVQYNVSVVTSMLTEYCIDNYFDSCGYTCSLQCL